MNYTTNYHLPQWVKSDRIMMDDFNEMNGSIEAGMTETAAEAAAATAAANAAQSVATTAKQTADAAFSPSQMPYVTGSYQGTGGARTIELGFRPSFVIVSGMKTIQHGSPLDELACYFGASGGYAVSSKLQITDTGFTLHQQDVSYGYYPYLNAPSRWYDYIAFK